MGGSSSSYLHHHHRHPCPPYMGPGPSGFPSSQSSDNYTTCSCESCSITSPSSTSFSVQVTDETYDSSRVSTPSETGGDGVMLPRDKAVYTPTPSPSALSQVPPDVIPVVTPDVVPVQRPSSNALDSISPLAPQLSLPLHSLNTAGPSHRLRLPLSPLILLSPLPAGQVHPLAVQREKAEHEASGSTPRSAVSPPKLVLFSPSNMEEPKRDNEEEEYEDDDDEEDHFRHRRLTGDSGIEVCRCHVKRLGQKEAQKENTSNIKEGKGIAQSPHRDDCAERSSGVSSASRVIQKTGEAIITVESS